MRIVTLLTGCLLMLSASLSAASAPDYSRTPVVFVHGHGGSAAKWHKLMSHLVQNGYPQEYLYTVSIVPATMANIQAAHDVISPAVESLLTTAGVAARKAGRSGYLPQRVDIVSHSMGALSSRWYAAKLRPERVRTLITLAGANHGTDVLCGYPDDGSRDLCPAFADRSQGNLVQTGLNGYRRAPLDETPYGSGTDRAQVTRVPPDNKRRIAYFSVRIEPDEWIKPERSAILDGAGGVTIAVPSGSPVKETSPGNFLFDSRPGILGQNVDHDTLLENTDLLRLVAAMLAARDP
jgi:pimeloyl-ACP methyl ester carboxylesterase